MSEIKKIKIDLTTLSEHDQDDFIDGFRSIFAMDDYNDPYVETPWCCPWTYTESIDVEYDESIEKKDYFNLGKNYALSIAHDIVSDAVNQDIQSDIIKCIDIYTSEYNYDSINDFESRFLELEDLNSQKDKENPELSGIIFTITDYAKQFIEVFEPELDVSYIGAKESFDIGKIDKNNMRCFDSDNCPVDLDQVNPDVVIFLNKLCELAVEWRDTYVHENYAEQNEQINHCGLDANSTENNLIKKKAKTL